MGHVLRSHTQPDMVQTLHNPIISLTTIRAPAAPVKDVLKTRSVFFSSQGVYSNSDTLAFGSRVTQLVQTNYNQIIIESLRTDYMTDYEWFNFGPLNAWEKTDNKSDIKNEFHKNSANLIVTCGDASDPIFELDDNCQTLAHDFTKFWVDYVKEFEYDGINIRLNYDTEDSSDELSLASIRLPCIYTDLYMYICTYLSICT